MPRYEYVCPANGRTIEVSHTMADRLSTWGEVCERAELDPGETPADAPVAKAFSLSFVRGVSGSRPTPSAEAVGCGAPACCMLPN